ncbi:histidine phosphatase family protein [Chitinimonas arctica]|uniref:Histidine phosphatase family protein n=1 Tax=Chitinimonas arctica TaxID=2594795 RepID=A0A516SEK2_9NEIS|nr:histidine phosphatase family protein [Chitinimonas arctica]QDQ26448.1 histidine phosphatase family protein [Chitinimonas arctica]
MKTNLILWRHAEAEDGEDDLARSLTLRGHKQANKVGEWLRARLPANARIVASEALRARQTAAALYPEHGVDARLNPCMSASDYLTVSGWPDAGGTIVLVGHQPTIGQLAAKLLSGIEADWAAKKGAIWWLQYRLRDGMPQTRLKTMLAPDQL